MGDVYMLNGKILSGLPNHAKDIEFDNTGTTLSSTNTEDAIKEVNSNLPYSYLGALSYPNEQSLLVDVSQYEIIIAKLTDSNNRALATHTILTRFINVNDFILINCSDGNANHDYFVSSSIKYTGTGFVLDGHTNSTSMSFGAIYFYGRKR